MPKGSSKSKSMANLKPWKKGESGNPAGTSKAVRQFHDDFKSELMRQLAAPTRFDPKGKTTRLQAIVKRLLDAAEGGEIPAVREIFDRLIGRPVQALETSGDGNTGLTVIFDRIHTGETS